MGLTLGIGVFTKTLVQIDQRGMQQSVGRNWKGIQCKNDPLDVIWVQLKLNQMIEYNAIPSLTQADMVPINGQIKTTETYAIPGSTIRALIALQTYKLKHLKPSGQIQVDDATHTLLKDWKRPISIDLQFQTLQKATLESTEWTNSTVDQEMKGVIEILVNSKNPDDHFLDRGIVRNYIENPGGKLEPSSLSRILFNEFEKRINNGEKVDPVQWIKYLRTVHKEILRGILEIGASGSMDDVTNPLPWAKKNPGIDRKKTVFNWFLKKKQMKNSIIYPFRKRVDPEGTIWGVPLDK